MQIHPGVHGYKLGMYLRTTSRKNRDGSVVTYLQLAESQWDPEKQRSRTVVVHNFGRADTLDREVLVRLCRSIARLCGLEVRDPLQEGEGAAGALADEVVLGRSRILGTVWVIEALWERLGIGPTLRSIAAREGRTAPYERALLAMTANRLCAPSSKLGVWERWLDRVHLPSCQGIKLDQMYEAMDFLHAHAEEVEEAVFFHTANLYNLEVDLVFFDTTTASFSIDDVDETDDDGPGLRQRGHSKEGTWTAQVVVALAVTREGLPIRSWVFPGNTADVSVVEKVRKDLRGWKLSRVLFVADSGMNSADNRQTLAKAAGRYVLACRAGSVAEIQREVLARPGRYAVLADNLRVKEVVVGEGERRRRYVVCFNPLQAEREQQHREQVVQELEAELASHPGQDANAKWAVKLRASGRYGRYLAVTHGKLRIDRRAVKQAARLDGKWVLITNDDTLAVADVAQAYKGLLVIERCFRSMKRTQIQMQPMFHWAPRRIETHVKICVLALLVQRIAELGCGRPWPRLRHALEAVHATEFKTPTHRFFQVGEQSPEVASLLGALDIKPPPKVLAVETRSDDVENG